MKYFLLYAFLLQAIHLRAQYNPEVSLGITAGHGFATNSFRNIKNKYSFTTGLYAIIPFDKSFAIQAGVNYSQYEAISTQSVAGKEIAFRLRTGMLEHYVQVKRTSRLWTGFTGLKFTRFMNSSKTALSPLDEAQPSFKDEYRSVELLYGFGASYQICPKLRVSGQFNADFMPVLIDDWSALRGAIFEFALQYDLKAIPFRKFYRPPNKKKDKHIR